MKRGIHNIDKEEKPVKDLLDDASFRVREVFRAVAAGNVPANAREILSEEVHVNQFRSGVGYTETSIKFAREKAVLQGSETK